MTTPTLAPKALLPVPTTEEILNARRARAARTARTLRSRRGKRGAGAR